MRKALDAQTIVLDPGASGLATISDSLKIAFEPPRATEDRGLAGEPGA